MLNPPDELVRILRWPDCDVVLTFDDDTLRRFRVTVMRETLSVDDGGHVRHRVYLNGPRLTRDGRDHARSYESGGGVSYGGGRSYSATPTWSQELPLTALPGQFQEYVLGEAAMRALLGISPTGAAW